VIDSTRLLGTIIQNDLTWNKNTSSLVKKANGRMELLRRVASFGTPTKDLKEI
jgi:GTPase SAR1 family protein